MKKTILIIFGVIVIISAYAIYYPNVDFKKESESGIKFYKENWNQVIARSKAEHKLIFLDIYASWCGPCKRLAKYTFSNEGVGKFYNHNFINISLDGENGEGLILANKLGISGYPSLIFLDSTGTVIKATMGYHNSNEFLNLGKSVMNVK